MQYADIRLFNYKRNIHIDIDESKYRLHSGIQIKFVWRFNQIEIKIFFKDM